jgi:hypothetical protein
MSVYEIRSYRDPVDLLQRFAPTPFKVSVPIGFASVLLETNDLSFVASMPPPGAAAFDATPASCLWKLVRDVDAPQRLTEATIVMAGNLVVYSMGPACIIAADRERREVLAFIGTEADARIFREAIFPALCRLTEFVTRPASHEAVSSAQAFIVKDVCNA